MLLQPGSRQFIAVTGVARVYGNERLKRPKRLNVNGNSTTLRHQQVTRWDRASFFKIEISIQWFAKCILSSRLTVHANNNSRQIDCYKNALQRFLAITRFMAQSL